MSASADIQLGYKNSAWFTANATRVLKSGQVVFLTSNGTYKIGDGTTVLSALTFYGGSGSNWGSITGTLSSQTDLQAALDAKQAAGTYATGSGTANGTNTGDETAARIATINHGSSIKTTLVDADELTGQDSAATFSLIRVTCLNVYNYLKAKFDTVYQVLNSNLTTIAGLTATTDNFMIAASGVWASRTPAQARISLGTGLMVDYNNTPTSGTNTTSRELLHSLAIPANLILTGDFLRVIGKCTNNNSVGTKVFSVWINSSSSLSGAIQLMTIVSNTTNTFVGFVRDIAVLSDTTVRVSSAASNAQNAETGVSTTVVPNTITTPSFAAGVYIIIACIKSAGTDTDTVDTSELMLHRK